MFCKSFSYRYNIVFFRDIAELAYTVDTAKLLVAEKIGLIRFYNVETQRPILSLDVGKPLSSAHWAPFDTQLVGSLQHGELLLWDLTRLRYNCNCKTIKPH